MGDARKKKGCTEQVEETLRSTLLHLPAAAAAGRQNHKDTEREKGEKERQSAFFKNLTRGRLS